MKEQIKKLIADGEIDRAIQSLVEKTEATDLAKEIIVISARYQANERKNRLGIIDTERYYTQRNEVVYELIQLVDQMQEKPDGSVEMSHSEQSVKKILFAEANPLGQNLYSNIELRELEEIVGSEVLKLELKISLATSLERLLKRISAYRPDVVHVSAFSNEEGIFFHDKSDQAVQINTPSLVSTLQLPNARVGCFLFNTFISEALARRLSDGEAFAIGYNGIINSHDAIDFANGFYNAIGYGKDYDSAFEVGCRTISNRENKDTLSKIFGYFDGQRLDVSGLGS